MFVPAWAWARGRAGVRVQCWALAARTCTKRAQPSSLGAASGTHMLKILRTPHITDMDRPCTLRRRAACEQLCAQRSWRRCTCTLQAPGGSAGNTEPPNMSLILKALATACKALSKPAAASQPQQPHPPLPAPSPGWPVHTDDCPLRLLPHQHPRTHLSASVGVRVGGRMVGAM